MTSTTLLERLIAVEPSRASAHRRLWQLRQLALDEKPTLLRNGVISRATITRIVRSLRAAGVLPIADGETLASVAAALDLTTKRQLVCLLWGINGDRSQSFAAAGRRWAHLVAEVPDLTEDVSSLESGIGPGQPLTLLNGGQPGLFHSPAVERDGEAEG